MWMRQTTASTGSLEALARRTTLADEGVIRRLLETAGIEESLVLAGLAGGAAGSPTGISAIVEIDAQLTDLLLSKRKKDVEEEEEMDDEEEDEDEDDLEDDEEDFDDEEDEEEFEEEFEDDELDDDDDDIFYDDDDDE